MIVMKIDMQQDRNLVTMPMQTLHFILNFKIVVINKINNRHNYVGYERFNAFFETLSPHCATNLC
jgi:hypothetical protein